MLFIQPFPEAHAKAMHNMNDERQATVKCCLFFENQFYFQLTCLFVNYVLYMDMPCISFEWILYSTSSAITDLIKFD